MSHSNQHSSLRSEERPRRTPEDTLFNVQVYQHDTSLRYSWSEEQSKIFQDYVQEFPNNYAQKLDILLERLDLHGYEGIETEQGSNFQALILIPKVLRKITNIINKSQKSKHGGNQRTSHNSNSDSYTQASYHYSPRPTSGPSNENTELQRNYEDAIKSLLENDEFKKQVRLCLNDIISEKAKDIDKIVKG